MEKNCAKMSKLKILLALFSQCFGKPTTKKEDKDERSKAKGNPSWVHLHFHMMKVFVTTQGICLTVPPPKASLF